MDRPTIVVVGLGPGDGRLLTSETRDELATATLARLRTRRHPAAASFPELASYDDLYEAAESFDALYTDIANDLVALASAADGRRIVYAVPGSPTVAERTVELLVGRDDVDVVLRPAISIIDVACSSLRRDPMTAGLRVVDALAGDLVGPGPLLVLQAYAPEVLAALAARLAPDTAVTVLYHLALDDQLVVEMPAHELAQFDRADHLTSLWIERVRDAGAEMTALTALTHRLRAECVWDQEQTHESLLRHLLEETYETIDAIERYVDDGYLDASEVVEELGDLLFQIAFHSELGDEAGAFDFADVAEHVRLKLVSRHPHVFADAVVTDARDAAQRWEVLKREEKSRASVTDGVPLQLPALTLHAKMRRKALAVGLEPVSGPHSRERAIDSLTRLTVLAEPAGENDGAASAESAWAELIVAVSDLARWSGVDLEGVLRRRSLALREEIIAEEAKNPFVSSD